MAEQKQEFTKYEEARIIGARALQLAMNAPLLVKISEEDLDKIHYDALKIAEIELKTTFLIKLDRTFVFVHIHLAVQSCVSSGPLASAQRVGRPSCF